MKRLFSIAQASVLASLAMSLPMIGAAQAQTTGIATTDLNIRSGPGPEQPAIGLIKSRQRAAILGCIEGSLWCQVEFRGLRGWAYSQYMSLNAGGRRIVVTEPAHVRDIPVVTYDAPTVAVAPGVAVAPAARVVETTGAAPAVAGGALIAPLPNIAPGTATLIAPPPTVGSYVTSNPGDPIALEGEVVVGAGLPPSVSLNSVPDYRYQYVYVNDTPVLVDPASRRIVYVFR
jgi:uncharacterized protein YraI